MHGRGASRELGGIPIENASLADYQKLLRRTREQISSEKQATTQMNDQLGAVERGHKAEEREEKAALDALTKTLHSHVTGSEVPARGNHSSGRKALLREAYRLLEEQQDLKQRYRRAHSAIKANVEKIIAVA